MLDGISDRTSEGGYAVDQTAIWFDEAYELSIAANAIKREAVNGHLYLNPALSPEQVKQRQAILGIAHAVIESARKRALDNFHGTICQEKNIQGGL